MEKDDVLVKILYSVKCKECPKVTEIDAPQSPMHKRRSFNAMAQCYHVGCDNAIQRNPDYVERRKLEKLCGEMQSQKVDEHNEKHGFTK